MRNNKTAFVTGITGQDGGYLAELLLDKGYEVHALRRRTSSDELKRIENIYGDKNLHLHYGDLTDTASLVRLFDTHIFNEVYNLAAQSHVRVSFDVPEYTADVDAMGALRLLECIRMLGMENHTKFYQASTSELYGKVQETPQTETTPFYPRSPYGVAKLFAYWMVKNYRESYDMFACNGILFNHESPYRGNDFVTKKIVRAAVAISEDRQDRLTLGNLDAQRDWGHAKDYVRGMYLMLQQDKPEDYVLATGEMHSVRECCEYVFNKLDMPLTWQGEGIEEKGYFKDKCVIDCSEEFFRPAEVQLLNGDSSKAQKELGWTFEYNFKSLMDDMITTELEEADSPFARII